MLVTVAVVSVYAAVGKTTSACLVKSVSKSDETTKQSSLANAASTSPYAWSCNDRPSESITAALIRPSRIASNISATPSPWFVSDSVPHADANRSMVAVSDFKGSQPTSLAPAPFPPSYSA